MPGFNAIAVIVFGSIAQDSLGPYSIDQLKAMTERSILLYRSH